MIVCHTEDVMSLSNMALQLVKPNGEWSLQLLHCHFGEQTCRISVISVLKALPMLIACTF